MKWSKQKLVLFPVRDKYSCQRFAYLTFENSLNAEAVLCGDNRFIIKGCPLLWVDADAKTCHECSSPDHLVKQCNERQDAYEHRQRIAQYKKVYTRYRVSNYKKYSYYQHQPRDPISKQNLTSNEEDIVTQQGRGNFDKNSTAFYSAFSEINKTLMELKSELSNVKQRLNILENNTNLDKGKQSTEPKQVHFTTEQPQGEKQRQVQ